MEEDGVSGEVGEDVNSRRKKIWWAWFRNRGLRHTLVVVASEHAANNVLPYVTNVALDSGKHNSPMTSLALVFL